jgi:nucleoside-diphosphate kinase
MYDKKMSRVFLKRVEVPSLKLSDLFVGAQVTVFTRVLKVQEYGDIATAKKQSVERESTFAMIKPDSYQKMG